MSSGSLPITFRALGNATEKPPAGWIERTVSSLASDELLVRVAFASINPMDAKLQRNNYFGTSLPVLGFDFSGTVVAVSEQQSGDGDAAVGVGSEVFGFSFNGGCFAEYAVTKRGRVALRESMPLKEAGTLGIAYISAWEPLERVAHISQRAEQWIYIAGAAGGVGHFATQLAKNAGLKVIGSASKPDTIGLLKQLGVDHVIDYSKQDVVAEVLAITGGKGADVVYDPTYKKDSMTQSAGCVASGGMWLRLGPQNADSAEAVKVAEGRGATATHGEFGRYLRDPAWISQLPLIRKALVEVTELYKDGKVRPHVNAVVPFDPAALQKALEENLHGKSGAGKVLVKVE